MQKRFPLPERAITVLSMRQTGETLLDETLKMMKQTEDAGEKMGVDTWVDLLSGEQHSFSFAPSFLFLSSGLLILAIVLHPLSCPLRFSPVLSSLVPASLHSHDPRILPLRPVESSAVVTSHLAPVASV